MASITLKSLPVALHRVLKARASGNNRSLNQEVIEILERSVAGSRRINVEAMLEEERKFRASLKFVATDKEINEFKRAGRP